MKITQFHQLNDDVEIDECTVSCNGEEVRFRCGMKGVPPHVEIIMSTDQWIVVVQAVTQARWG